MAIFAAASLSSLSILVAASSAIADSPGATVTHWDECFPTEIFTGGGSFSTTFCIEGLTVYNFAETPSGLLTITDHARLRSTYSGGCTGEVENTYNSHALAPIGEGVFETGFRGSYHAVLDCGDGAFQTECDVELHFHEANGEVQFYRDNTVCT
jgi:hypothetical protein